jgi:hypothetical protein
MGAPHVHAESEFSDAGELFRARLNAPFQFVMARTQMRSP